MMHRSIRAYGQMFAIRLPIASEIEGFATGQRNADASSLTHRDSLFFFISFGPMIGGGVDIDARVSFACPFTRVIKIERRV